MNSLWQFAKKYVFPLWIWFAAGFVFLAVTNLITLEIPLLAKKIVNGLKNGNQIKNPQNIALLIIGFGLMQILIRWFSRIFIFWPGRKFEAMIQKATASLLKDRTVIAHRLSTIRQCDSILVLDKGMVLEQGTHTVLLKKKGHYYALHKN